jgi:hypothetical protein
LIGGKTAHDVEKFAGEKGVPLFIDGDKFEKKKKDRVAFFATDVADKLFAGQEGLNKGVEIADGACIGKAERRDGELDGLM